MEACERDEATVFAVTSGAPLISIFCALPIGDVGCLSCASPAVYRAQRESWVLWQGLLERDAPEEKAHLVSKAGDKQVAAVWRGAVRGRVLRLASARSRAEARLLQAAIRQLLGAHPDAGPLLVGRGIDSQGYAVSSFTAVPECCAVSLEASWVQQEGHLSDETVAAVFIRQAPDLFRSGIPRPGKWSSPKSLFEFVALACAPPEVVDSVLARVGGFDGHPGVIAGLLEGIRCNRSHLVSRLLTELSSSLLCSDPRCLAMACYAKNSAAVMSLLQLAANPNARCPAEFLAFPEDDTFWPNPRRHSFTTPLALAVRGRAVLPSSVWSAAPALVNELLLARASPTEGDPLDALLAQGPRISRSCEVMLRHHDSADQAWSAAWQALLEAGVQLQGELLLHAAARPQYVGQLMDSGLLCTEVVAACDSDGISALTRLAMRAVSTTGYNFVYLWHPFFWRVLSEFGTNVSLTELVDNSAYCGIEDARVIPLAPCPVLALAVKWHDSVLVGRCIEFADQSLVNACAAWRRSPANVRRPHPDSLLYTLAFVGRSRAVEAAIQRGLHFKSDDYSLLHGDAGKQLGPVASLAVAAARHAEQFAPLYWICPRPGCRELNGANHTQKDATYARICKACDSPYHDEVEVAGLGEAAAAFLRLGLEDPERLMVLDGVPGGLDAVEALSEPGIVSRCGVPAEWWLPVRRWLRERRSPRTGAAGDAPARGHSRCRSWGYDRVRPRARSGPRRASEGSGGQDPDTGEAGGGGILLLPGATCFWADAELFLTRC